MINFEIYQRDLRKLSNIEKCYKSSDKRDIIKATLKSGKHNMLVKEDFDNLETIYSDLTEFDNIDLIDLLEYEKELWTSL